MASAATNLFDAELVIGITLGGGTDKAGKSIQIPPKAFPFATPALNIRISPITVHATSANGMFLEVEHIRIWHPIQNLTHCANGSTTRTDQGSNPFKSLGGHIPKLLEGTDKNSSDNGLSEVRSSAQLIKHTAAWNKPSKRSIIEIRI